MKRSIVLCSEKNKGRLAALYAAGLSFLLFSLFFGVLSGSSGAGLPELCRVFAEGDYHSAAGRIFLYVRVPRVIAAALCGAALSAAGAAIQAVLSNRPASPSIIGVNSGAGLAVTIASAMGLYSGWRLSLLAFAGALLTVLLVCLLSRRFGTRSGTLILIGVAVNALCGAVSDAIVTFDTDISAMTFDFRVGDFSSVTYEKIGGAGFFVAGSVILLLLCSKALDVLSLGEENSRGLGMNCTAYRTLILILCAVLAGCAVSVAGLLSFVGLMVPHALRRAARTRHLHLLCLCALWGGGFVCFCDTVARCVFSPYEIPVGIIMAFLGAPFFMLILLRGKGESADA